MKQILVTGATGQLGRQVLEFLVKKTDAKSLSAIARDTSKLASFKEQGVNVIAADYDDKASLLNAFNGIDTIYFVSGNDIPKRTNQHKTVIEAAKEAGVKQVVYTSFQRKDETANSPIASVAETHLQTEKWLKESGVNYTILKHALYSDVIPMFIGEQVLQSGVIYQPSGDGKVSYATRKDMAEAAAVILTTEGHENKSYEISSGKSYSYNDIAQILSDVSGKTINYVSPSADEFKKTLLEAGVPAGIIDFSLVFATGIKHGEFDCPDQTLEKLLGREPEDLASFLTRVYSK